MSSLKSDLFVLFRVFYSKEFTRQKKVTNKLFISEWRVVIAKRGGGVRSAKRDSVSCVSMWWYMYIEGYILFFEILRIRGLSISPLSQKNKIKNPLRGAAVSLSKLSFDYFHYEKNRCCITV